MAEINRPIDDKDLSKNWVNSSRFLFYVSVFCLLSFVIGCSTLLYTKRWKGAGEPNVPESSKYTPKYSGEAK